MELANQEQIKKIREYIEVINFTFDRVKETGAVNNNKIFTDILIIFLYENSDIITYIDMFSIFVNIIALSYPKQMKEYFIQNNLDYDFYIGEITHKVENIIRFVNHSKEYYCDGVRNDRINKLMNLIYKGYK